MNIHNFKLKSTLLSSIIFALTACGGDGEGKNNSAPVFNADDIVQPAIQGKPDVSACSYVESEVSGVMETRCVFKESDRFVAGDLTVDTWEIDLRVGATDADPRNQLSVKDMVFLWEGINCMQVNVAIEEDWPTCSSEANIDVDIAVLPEEERQIYIETTYGLAEDLGIDTSGMATEAEVLSAIDALEVDDAETGIDPNLATLATQKLRQWRLESRKRLPRFTHQYGVRRDFNSFFITPTELIPILREGERAELHVEYFLTDGKDTLTRHLNVIIEGEGSNPELAAGELSSNAFNTLDSAGMTVNLIQNVFDTDIEQQELLSERFGDLTRDELYGSDYTPEVLMIRNFRLTNPISGSEEGFGYTTNFDFQRGTTQNGSDAIYLLVDPSLFLGVLAPDEVRELIFEYDVVDAIDEQRVFGSLSRTITVTITGTRDPGDNPPVFSGPLNITFGTDDAEIPYYAGGGLDLFAGVRDADSVAADVRIESVTGLGSPVGFDTSSVLSNGVLGIDSIHYLPNKNRSDEIISFEVVYTDGTNLSDTRTVNINFNNDTLNILKGIDFGFESGDILDSSADADQTHWQVYSQQDGEVVEVSMADAKDGVYALSTPLGRTIVQLSRTVFPQGEIVAGRSYMVNFWAKTSNPWQALEVSFFKNAWNGGNHLLPTGALRSSPSGATDWFEHSVYFTAPGDLDQDDTIGMVLTAQGNNTVLFDDVSISQYFYTGFRDAIKFGGQTFEDDTLLATGFTFMNVPVDAAEIVTLVDQPDAPNSTYPGSGERALQIDTTGATGTTTLNLASDRFSQDVIKDQGRYRLEFFFRYPGWTGDVATGPNAQIIATIYDENEPTTQMRGQLFRANIAWDRLSYTFNVEELSPGVDWSTRDVALRIEIIQPDQIFLMDNIRFYRVP